MLLDHAPPGGKTVNGRVYRGGEFMPFYIARPYMPQVDEVHLPELLDFISASCIAVCRGAALPCWFSAHQRIDPRYVANMPLAVRQKPILVSADRFILDGNHRWHAIAARGEACNYIAIDRCFDMALSLLFQFPHTYSYGDGDFHPCSN